MTTFQVPGGRGESLADRAFAVAAMAGALAGAVGGVVLAAGWGAAFPAACGSAGAVLGGALAAGCWWVAATAGAGLFTGRAADPAAVRIPVLGPVHGVQ
jgi:hypothetical protein